MITHHSFRSNRWIVLLATFFAVAMAGCAHDLPGADKTPVTTAAPDSASPAHPEMSASDWTYPAMSGTRNNWAADGYHECGPEVAMQSPTLLDPATANLNTGWSLPTNLSSATYTVPLARIDSHNNYDFKVNPSGASLTIRWRGVTWRFIDFHFHVPAEHAVVGQTLAVMEMHVKASNVNNPTDVVVFAVPFVVDSQPHSVPVLAPVAAAMAGQSGQTFSLGPLLAAFTTKPTFIYMGGLTTPPCGGDQVRFYVLQYPLAVDLASWQSIAASLTSLNRGVNNVRPLQPRPVTTPSSIALVKS